MRHIFFEGELNDENVQKFATQLDEAESKSEKVIVYLNSEGGPSTNANILAELTDRYPFDLEIRVTWSAHSAAFDWLCKTKVEVTYMNEAHSGIHFASRKSDANEILDPSSGESFVSKQMREKNMEWLERVGQHLTKQEIGRLRKGNLVYLNQARAQKIVNEWPK